jgi:hypothetical protein
MGIYKYKRNCLYHSLVVNHLYYLSVYMLCAVLLNMLLAYFAVTNLRISLMPDSFFTSIKPCMYLAKGMSPGSYANSGFFGEYSGTMRSFLECYSIKL